MIRVLIYMRKVDKFYIEKYVACDKRLPQRGRLFEKFDRD